LDTLEWEGLPALAIEPPEPFEAWHRRIEHLLPNVPKEACREWLYRNQVSRTAYPFLPLDRLHFERVIWAEPIIETVRFGESWGNHKKWQEELRKEHHHFEDQWLWKWMQQNGTWPTPIIVLKSTGLRDPRWNELLNPLHLIEGHRRLEFLRGLFARGEARPTHDVFLATLM